MEDTIGRRIKECRLKLGMTQARLAELLFTKKSTISAYENNKIDIKVSILKELAGVLNTTVSFLVDGNDDELSSDVLLGTLLLHRISNEEIRKVAIEQVKLLARLDLK